MSAQNATFEPACFIWSVSVLLREYRTGDDRSPGMQAPRRDAVSDPHPQTPVDLARLQKQKSPRGETGARVGLHPERRLLVDVS
jgi:hypothetical protein